MTAEKFQKRQQGKTEDGEKVAFDARKQLSPQTFELVSADGFQCVRPQSRKIVANKDLAQWPHHQGSSRAMVPDPAAATGHANAGQKFMALAAQGPQVAGRMVEVGRFVEPKVTT